MVKSKLEQEKSDFEDGWTFYGLFEAPRSKNCLKLNEFGIIEEKKAFKGYQFAGKMMKTHKYFELKDGKPKTETFTAKWKKVECGMYIPTEKKSSKDFKIECFRIKTQAD